MTTNLTSKAGTRGLRRTVWTGRAVGILLLLTSMFAALSPQFDGALRGLAVIPAVALAFVAVAWLVGLELFLHFFDRYLSRN